MASPLVQQLYVPGSGPEPLVDWPEERFIDHILSQLPPPLDEITGEPLWEKGLTLFPSQRRFVLDPIRWKQAAGGIRGGKSQGGALLVLLDTIWRLEVRGFANDLWGILGDTYDMSQEEMRHLSRFYTDLGIPHDLRTPEHQRWTLKFPDNEQEIHTLTGQDVTKIASRAYRGIVVAEAAQCDYEAYLNAQDRVSQKRGWVAAEGTFEHRRGSWYGQQAVQWQSRTARGRFYSLPSWENFVAYPGGRDDPEIKSREIAMPRPRFLERFGGEPMKRSDLQMLYPDKRWHVKRRYPQLGTSYDPDLPVYLFSDPGISHAYAVIAVQFHENVTWVIDVVYRWGRTVHQIVQECAKRPWAHRVEQAVMDIAARQRRAEGEPVIEQWAKLWPKEVGNRIDIFTQPVPLQAGYDIHELALLNSWPEDQAQEMFNADGKIRQMTDPTGPRIYFDPMAQAPLFGGMVDDQEYDGEYNLHRTKKLPDGTVAPGVNPIIDTDNDAIKAINYGCYWRYGSVGEKLDRRRGRGRTWVPWEMVS